MRRIAVGKLAGFAFGAIGFLLFPWVAPDAGFALRLGVLLWYTTIGAVIGVFGVVDMHPVFRVPLPWWVRAPLITAWFNVVLSLFAYPTMAPVVAGVWPWEGLGPFLLGAALEGIVIGLIIGHAVTRLYGDGPGIVYVGQGEQPNQRGT